MTSQEEAAALPLPASAGNPPAAQAAHDEWFLPADDFKVPAQEDRWLVESLLGKESVAVIGGDPKVGKSWLAAHLAVAVASGESCLQQQTVHDPGPVLIVSAEGPPWMPTDRLRQVCGHQGLALDQLPIKVMSRNVPRLDAEEDQRRLLLEVRGYKAKLLILDPLMQLHSGDENSAKGLAPVLQFLNRVRRESGSSVLLIHHVTKGAKGNSGSRLRGSSSLHGWLDSGLYLRRRGSVTQLATEQRCGAPTDPMLLRLVTDSPNHHLEAVGPDDCEVGSNQCAIAQLKDRIMAVLADSKGVAVPREKLRAVLGIKNERLSNPLSELEDAGVLVRSPRGIILRSG